MDKEQAALALGTYILNAIQYMQDERLDFGNQLIIPYQLKPKANFPEFITNISITMPTYLERYYERGEIRTRTVTMAEFYNWPKVERD